MGEFDVPIIASVASVVVFGASVGLWLLFRWVNLRRKLSDAEGQGEILGDDVLAKTQTEGNDSFESKDIHRSDEGRSPLHAKRRRSSRKSSASYALSHRRRSRLLTSRLVPSVPYVTLSARSRPASQAEETISSGPLQTEPLHGLPDTVFHTPPLHPSLNDVPLKMSELPMRGLATGQPHTIRHSSHLATAL